MKTRIKTELTLDNLFYCYKGILNLHKRGFGRDKLLLSLGYLEACLANFGYLEIVEIDGKVDIKTEIVKYKFLFWIRERKESRLEALIRMTENLLNDKNIKL